MIVKILSNAGSFAGIRYNERKNDQGSSELLLAQNFEALGHGESEVSKTDYVNYLKMISSLNPRVDKKQFHAIISTQGQSHSPEELKEIAVQYLEHMGYGENPYLIYSHSDTPNNHVHIVTCRVNKKGEKIDDSYERVRSQKVMQEILAQNPQETLKAVLKDVLSYQCATLAQYKLLLERHGYRVQDNTDTLKIIKHGILQQVIPKEIFTQNLQNQPSAAWKARTRQLKAIFKKYKSGMDTDYFIKFARQKFGIDIILHQQKGHDAPYGYTIIDHKQKFVFKGSQVMPLERLLDSIRNEEKIKHLHHILKTLAEEHAIGYGSLKKEVQSLGFDINNHGQIFRVGEEGPVLVATMDNKLLKESKYRDRAEEALTYQASSDRAQKALVQLFFINPDVLEHKMKESTLAKERQILQDKLQAIAQYYTIHDGLKKLGLEIVKYQGQYFVLDRENKVMFDYREVGNERLSLPQADIIHLDRLPAYDKKSTSRPKTYEERLTGGHTDLSSLLSILSTYDEEDGNLETVQKKKRKR